MGEKGETPDKLKHTSIPQRKREKEEEHGVTNLSENWNNAKDVSRKAFSTRLSWY